MVLPEPERGAAMMRPVRRHREGSALAPHELFADLHDVADHDDRRRLDAVCGGFGCDASERRDEDALAAGRRRGDDGGGGIRGEATADERGGDLGEIAHRHVEHDRLAGPRQRRPVRRTTGIGAIAGGEDHRAVDAAPGRRDARRGERREARGDAGNDAERHAGRGERFRLLAAAARTRGIAALEPQHALAGPRQHDEPLRNVLLGRRRPAAALAGEFEPRPRPGEREHARIDQRVVDDDVRLVEPGQRIEGEQPGIARPRAGQPDMARLQHRNAAAARRKIGPGGHVRDARAAKATAPAARRRDFHGFAWTDGAAAALLSPRAGRGSG